MVNLSKEIKSAINQYPLLKRFDKNSVVTVEGSLELINPDYGKVDMYDVEITFPESYPFSFPNVKETSNKIPKIPSRHINTANNTLCLAVRPEEKLICRNGINFIYFIEKILLPHFNRETYRELEGVYPDGEYDHGTNGLWQYYINQLPSNTNKEDVIMILELIITNGIGRNDLCYCGSEKKLKKCHLFILDKLALLGRSYLEKDLNELKQDLMQ